MTGLCPHCGADLALDEPVKRGELEMQPYGDCKWHGSPVSLTAYERAVLFSILKADGRPITRAALCERIGYEGVDPDNIIDAYVSKIRRKLAAVGYPPPIESVRRVGLRWAA